LESELTAVRAELQQKSWSLAQQQASIENLAQVHREQIRKLEARLASTNRSLNDRLATSSKLSIEPTPCRSRLMSSKPRCSDPSCRG
jgi:hypothetical protein